MSRRTEKVEKLIKEEISLIFLYEIPNKFQDTDIGFITITDVKVSADLKIAKIYISVFNKDKRDYVLEKVKLKTGFIRSLLASRIRMKFTPELKFFIDDTLDYVEKIEVLIKKIHKDDNQSNN